MRGLPVSAFSAAIALTVAPLALAAGEPSGAGLSLFEDGAPAAPSDAWNGGGSDPGRAATARPAPAVGSSMPARLGPQRPSDDRRSGREDERNGRALMLLLVRSVGSLGPFGTMGQW